MIYTVGNEQNYDLGLSKLGREFKKLGSLPGWYPGGFVVRTIEDGIRLVREQGTSDWAVYEVDADWINDTKPSARGWWHALQRDAVIVRKVVDAQGNLIEPVAAGTK